MLPNDVVILDDSASFVSMFGWLREMGEKVFVYRRTSTDQDKWVIARGGTPRRHMYGALLHGKTMRNMSGEVIEGTGLTAGLAISNLVGAIRGRGIGVANEQTGQSYTTIVPPNLRLEFEKDA